MIYAQLFNDSYKNPTEYIDYGPIMQTRYDKYMPILMRIDSLNLSPKHKVYTQFVVHLLYNCFFCVVSRFRTN